jgi:hypothetical protein
MAVQLLSVYDKYLCVAADVKPIVGIKIGSRILETDTDKVFVWDGTNWTEITGLSF